MMPLSPSLAILIDELVMGMSQVRSEGSGSAVRTMQRTLAAVGRMSMSTRQFKRSTKKRNKSIVSTIIVAGIGSTKATNCISTPDIIAFSVVITTDIASATNATGRMSRVYNINIGRALVLAGKSFLNTGHSMPVIK